MKLSAIFIGVQRMKRRHFLGALCALGANSPALSGPLTDEYCRRQRLHARIAALSSHPASASQITKVYRTRLPRRPSVAVMLDELHTITDCSPSQLLNISKNELLAIFSNRIKKDFEEERTVDIDGWLMSETEIFFCEIVASHQMQNTESRATSNPRSMDQIT